MLNSIKLKKIKIENPVILAPQAGITDFIFREFVASFGNPFYSTSLTVSEMVPSISQVSLLKSKQTEKVKKLYIPYKSYYKSYTSVQIFGNDPIIMAESAKINEGLGADIIDINMGCPVNKIIKNGCGADLMLNHKLAFKIVKNVVDSVSVPVSVKIRSGWDQNKKNAVDFARVLEEAGANFVTIHGRTRNQFYSGNVDLDIIKDVKNSIKIPVIGNGDIYSPQDAKKMFEYTSCDGVMVGRGIYGKPWLLYHIIYFLKTGVILPSLSVLEIKEILLKHLVKIFEYYGDKVGIFLSRKHIAWYSKGLKNSTEFRNLINTMDNKKDIFKAIDDFFICNKNN